MCVWRLNSFDVESIHRPHPIEKRRREENHERKKLFDDKENTVIGEELEENARQRNQKFLFPDKNGKDMLSLICAPETAKCWDLTLPKSALLYRREKRSES